MNTAHQIVNTGRVPLIYIAVSSMHHPDVMEYPDSSKITVFAGAAPGGKKEERSYAASLKSDAIIDYWDGES